MHALRTALALLLCMASATALAQGLPSAASLRYSAQVSNGSAGGCGCFTMQGAAGELVWPVRHPARIPGLGIVFDFGAEHVGQVGATGYGLTVATFTAGPRIALPSYRAVRPFAQATIGIARGSGGQLPRDGTLLSTAGAFAFGLAVGADYPVNRYLSLRLLQLEVLHTDLPNNNSNWQNNLRIGTGVNFHR